MAEARGILKSNPMPINVMVMDSKEIPMYKIMIRTAAIPYAILSLRIYTSSQELNLVVLCKEFLPVSSCYRV
jgi:hypothetical protein